jgi:PBSX family phage terminase large subunit
LAERVTWRIFNTPDNLMLVRGLARRGLTNKQIAECCKINVGTLYEWQKDHPEFNDALKEGKEIVDIHVENALFKNACSGNVTAQIFWLKNRQSKMWRDHPEPTKDAADAPSWSLPINYVTSDFVDPYRVAHEVLAGVSTIREIISKGGRGSIKSSFWSLFAYETIIQDPEAHVVFTRRYKVDLRDSVYNQFIKTVTRLNDLDNWDFTTSPMRATYKATGQVVLFVGCDKPISLKSYNLPFGYVKLLIHEEADEMAGVEQMDSVEDTFLRSDTPALDIKIFNPPKSRNNFMNEYAASKEGDAATYVCHSYYSSVPASWLGQRFFDRAEYFKAHKPEYFANNYMGEVIGTGGELFSNVVAETVTDERIKSFDEIYQGIDWGYEHPQVFIRCAYERETDSVYIIGEHYKQRCNLVTYLKQIDEYKHNETICDSAEPDKIADAADYGWNVIGATKRWKGGGRDYAWEWLRDRRRIVVDEQRTPRIAHELRTLEFEQLRDGSFSSRYPTLGEDGIMSTIYALNRVIMSEKDIDDYNDYQYTDDDTEDAQ